MATYTYPISTEHNIYPNLTVCERRADGVLKGWRVTPNDGYVMYDSTEEGTKTHPITFEEGATYYYTYAGFPLNYNWNNFTWVAVLRSEVDENCIFGVGDNDHEVM